MNMKTKIITAFLSTIMLTMTACRTIRPPIQATIAEATAESVLDSAASSEVGSLS